jgi:hypothetical protein
LLTAFPGFVDGCRPVPLPGGADRGNLVRRRSLELFRAERSGPLYRLAGGDDALLSRDRYQKAPQWLVYVSLGDGDSQDGPRLTWLGGRRIQVCL